MRVSQHQPSSVQFQLSPELKKGAKSHALHHEKLPQSKTDELKASRFSQEKQPVVHSLGFIEDAPQELKAGEIPLIKLLTLDWTQPMFTLKKWHHPIKQAW